MRLILRLIWGNSGCFRVRGARFEHRSPRCRNYEIETQRRLMTYSLVVAPRSEVGHSTDQFLILNVGKEAEEV